MSEAKNSLTPLQHKAIGHMLNSPTLGSAAKLAGVNEKTLKRWRDEPVFAAELRRAESDVMRDSVRMLTGSMALASVTIKGLMLSDDSTPGVKLRASLGLLNLVPVLRTLTDIEERLQALEQGGRHEQKH